jgi:hypothetical protein
MEGTPMEYDKRPQPRMDKAVQSTMVTAQTRMKCSFPITIKGFNALGEHYEDFALVEDVGWRGLCFRTDQIMIPGSIFTLYKTEEDLDPVATFEVVWADQYDDKIRKIGAQLVGDNHTWLRYLLRDIAILPGTKIVRSGES